MAFNRRWKRAFPPPYNKRMLISLLSLGCPKNLADSESLIRKLKANGAGFTEDPGRADVMLVNTCGFIEDAKRESVEEILTLAGTKKNGRRLVVLGCLAKRYRDELLREIPEIDAVFGVSEEEEIVRYIGPGVSGKPTRGGGAALALSPPHVAPIKVSEGCDRRCTFCVIPSIRGPLAVRRPEEILKEAEAYVRAGARELMLVAQDLTAYRYLDYGLDALLRDMASIGGEFWIRPLYLYPTGIDEKLLGAMAGLEKVCGYVDMPVQHSEDRMLRAMGRAGTKEEYLRLIRDVRRAMPGAALRTALIVGFPGETEEDFSGLMDFVEAAEFDRLGVFVYSKEEGAPAAKMKGQLPDAVKRRRRDAVMALQADISLRRNEALVGKKCMALVDSLEAGHALGRLQTQAREIDGLTYIKGMEGRGAREGDFLEIEITSAHDYDLEGVCV